MPCMADQYQAMYCMHLWTMFLLLQMNQPPIQETPSLQTTTKSEVPILLRTTQLPIQESHQLSNSCDNACNHCIIALHTPPVSTPPYSNGPTIQETPDDDEINSNPPHLNEPTNQLSKSLQTTMTMKSASPILH
jgi:hypothetical protein